MRSFVFLTAAAIAMGWGLVRHMPERAEADTARAGRPQEIQSVALDGRGLPVADLRQSLSTQAGDLVDPDKLARDRAALEATLVARGYLGAHVEDARVVYGTGGAAFVTFAITQGTQFRVRTVTVHGASVRDAGVVTIAAGEVPQAERIARAREALAERLAARGKRSTVTAEVVTDQAAGVVDIRLVARRAGS